MQIWMTQIGRYLVMVLGLVFFVPQAAWSQALLNSQVVVNTPHVTLSDIFSNLQAHHNYVITQAPEVGSELVLNMATLRKIADSFSLDWRPENSMASARITRQSQSVHVSAIEQALMHALKEELPRMPAGHKWELVLDNNQQLYHVPLEAAVNPKISYLRLDPQSQRFAADVRLYDNARPERIRGEAVVMVSVPVPVYSIEEGEVIRESDLHLVPMHKEKIAPNVQTDVSKIVGKSSRRILRHDTPIPMQYLQEPLMVKRKGLVSIVYVVKNLTLVTKGMALSDASMGQVVRVKNLKSNRIVDTVVVGPDEVSVSFSEHSFGKQIAQNK